MLRSDIKIGIKMDSNQFFLQNFMHYNLFEIRYNGLFIQ